MSLYGVEAIAQKKLILLYPTAFHLSPLVIIQLMTSWMSKGERHHPGVKADSHVGARRALRRK